MACPSTTTTWIELELGDEHQMMIKMSFFFFGYSVWHVGSRFPNQGSNLCLDAKEGPLPMSLKETLGSSLVVQWQRILLPMQETMGLRPLVREDPTCCRVTKPLCSRAQDTVTEPKRCNYWSPWAESPCSPTREATAMRSPHTTARPQPLLATTRGKSVQQQRPSVAKSKFLNN